MKSYKLLIPIIICFLSSCSSFQKWKSMIDEDNSSKKAFQEEYASIQLLLDHSKDYTLNWINSNEYKNLVSNQKQRCYDLEGIVYNLFYNAEYKIVTKEDVSFHAQTDTYVQYSIPYDDYAGIELRNDGYGVYRVNPDLSSLNVTVWFKFEQEITNSIFDVVNTMLAPFIAVN